MAATIGRLRAVLSANTKEFNQGFEKAKRSVGYLRKSIEPLAVSMKRADSLLKSTGTSLNHVDHALKKLGVAYKDASLLQNRFAISAKMKELHTLRASMIGASGAVKSMKSSFGGANMAVVNFNRIIQDSPYGIIGVANNIEPLLLSLKGLKQSTGSAMGAFRLLIKSAFTGPGALITAFSLASTAAVFFAKRNQGAGNSSKDAADKHQEQIKALESLRSAYENIAGLTTVEKLKKEISTTENLIALKEQLLEIDKKIAEDKISKTGVGLLSGGGLSEAQEKQVKSYEDSIDLAEKDKAVLEEKISTYKDGAKTVNELNESLEAKNKSLQNITGSTEKEIKIQQQLEEQQKATKLAIDKFKLGLEGSDEALVKQKKFLTANIDQLMKMAKAGDDSVIPFIVKYQKLLGDVDKELQKISKPYVPPRLSSLDLLKQDLKDVEKLIADSMDETQKLIDGAKIDFSKMFKMGSIADVEDQMNKVEEAIRLATSDEERERLRKKHAELQDQLNKMYEAGDDLQSKMIDVGLAIQQAVGPAITSFAETLGDAFSGKIEGAEQFFGSLLAIVADFTDQLGKLLIASGIASIEFKKLLTNPVAAIAAGTALVVLATATRNLLSEGLGGGGKETSVNDALITSKGQVIKFHPNDNILAMKDFGKLGGIINQQPAALNNIGSPSLNNIRRVQPIYLESSINLDGRQIYKGIQLTKARIDR